MTTFQKRLQRIGYAKWLSYVLLPSIATFVSAVGIVWDVPDIERYVMTITAISAMVGSIFMVNDTNATARALADQQKQTDTITTELETVKDGQHGQEDYR